ncbi:MAG: magnesium transporter [SAR86 cluster bacterium]|uniref:Magnesium transporter MgtE n=1 Tax=SAR86 cluster bacterium TaxID=2030880 RepID=A0A368BQB5_9GAMM|nr:MAG: magnesium transporter [SAR86 cluster bacterium]
MNEINSQLFSSEELLKKIQDQEAEPSINQIRRLLSGMHPSEVAHSIESLPPKERKFLWSLIDTQDEGEIIAELHDEIQQELISEISAEELITILGDLELDEIVDILQVLPDRKTENILSAMSMRDRKRIREALEYPEDSAGGLMNTDIISVRPKHNLEVVMRYLRAQRELPKNTDQIFVVSRENKFLGSLPISTIIVSDPNLNVRELMETETQPLLVDLNDKDVSRLFEQNDWVSAPVIDKESNLIGRITIDDVVDVIMEDADQNFLGMAGVAEDTFAPPARAAKSRILWLSINLLTAFIASMTISLFQATIDQIVYLAILMPIVASMGGVAGTQTLTIMIRGLTLQQINHSNLQWLYKREIAVSIVNGILLSILVGGITYLWFRDIIIATLICVAMVVNLVFSAIAGIFIPIILRKFNQDPAIAGSVVVTTVTDVIGFFSFLGLATIFLI